jgi:hypothetical protein
MRVFARVADCSQKGSPAACRARRKGIAQAGSFQDQKNELGRTSPNCGGDLFITRYASSKKGHSSEELLAGNLAGRFGQRLYNSLCLLENAGELEFSPGHKIFITFQFTKTLS